MIEHLDSGAGQVDACQSLGAKLCIFTGSLCAAVSLLCQSVGRGGNVRFRWIITMQSFQRLNTTDEFVAFFQEAGNLTLKFKTPLNRRPLDQITSFVLTKFTIRLGDLQDIGEADLDIREFLFKDFKVADRIAMILLGD